MCSKCDAINETIARYKRLRRQIDDQQLHDAAERLLMQLEAKKLALHPRN